MGEVGGGWAYGETTSGRAGHYMESQSIDMIGLRLSLADVSGDVTSVSHKVYQIMMTVHSFARMFLKLKIASLIQVRRWSRKS